MGTSWPASDEAALISFLVVCKAEAGDGFNFNGRLLLFIWWPILRKVIQRLQVHARTSGLEYMLLMFLSLLY
jgi:hypothetical protein